MHNKQVITQMCPELYNTLMRQRNYKVIVKCKLLETSKIGTFFNDYRHPILKNDILRQEYFSINITTGLYYELCHKILIEFNCKRFILLFKFSIQHFFIEDSKLKLFS